MKLKEQIKEAVMEWNEEELKEIIQTVLNDKSKTAVDLLNILSDIMRDIGDQFANEELFLPDLIGSANIVKNVIDDVLDPAIKTSGESKESLGKVVIGTVESDVHSIGKDLLASFLFSNGFEVFNLGEEVPAEKFIRKAEEVNAQIIALSSLLTMSMDFQRQVIEELENMGIRDKYKIVVGGAPTSDDWANQIGADGWADDAIQGVNLIKKLVKSNG
jgi:methylmalonyl-CoA mutase cobalamin-binding domain/chain